MAKKFKMHVISGTHWDREWRHTAEQSKPRLMDLVDSMIRTLEKHPDYQSFCLDGGLVVVEDYLSVRPENREKLTKLIQSGRVQLVNWYTLPDTFTVAPEAMIRNMKLGQDMAKEFGGTMAAGYTATSYGQTSQLPQLYQGFGISNAIFYRGTNKYFLKPLFRWQGKDGSELHTLRTFDEVTRTNWFFYVHQPLVVGKPARDLSYSWKRDEVPVHMCDSRHYERALKLLHEIPGFNQDPAKLKASLDTILKQAKPYMIGGKHILALNMEDNDVPFGLLPAMIEALNKVSPDVEIVQSSLDEYMATIIDSVKNETLPVHHGELRNPAVEEGFNGLLGATHSSRIKLKLLNEVAETGLIHHAEPLAAVAAMLGAEYPRTILDRAWKHLLLCHAHDSICGAAVDQAHEDMLYNFSIVRMVGEEVTSRSTTTLFKHINSAKVCQPGDHTVTLFNTLPFARKEVVPLVIDFPKESGGGGIIDPCTGVGGSKSGVEYFDLVDGQGTVLPSLVLSNEPMAISVERELDTNGIKMPGTRRRVLVEAEVPALGYATLALRPRGPNTVAHPPKLPDRPLMARENGVMENEHLKVTIHPNGTFTMVQKATGRVFEKLHYFTDNGETGSAHLVKAVQRNPVQTSIGSPAAITMVESNLLRGIYRIDLSLTVPAAATLDGRDRLRETRTIPITTWLTLEKGSPMLKVRTRVTNEARDHRLRVNFPSGVKTSEVVVESAFAVDKRDMQWTAYGDNFEGFYPFQPMQNFVALEEKKGGLAVLNKGLREYEVHDDESRTIAITLLRTQRAYMTANTDMTPDEFDKYTGLHSFGTLEYQMALMPYAGDWESAGVLDAAYQHKVMITGVQGVPVKGELPPTGSFLSVQGKGLVFSALKQADDGKGVLLRVWNSSGKTVNATVKSLIPVKSAERLTLREASLGKLSITSGVIKLAIKPYKIETIRLVG